MPSQRDLGRWMEYKESRSVDFAGKPPSRPQICCSICFHSKKWPKFVSVVIRGRAPRNLQTLNGAIIGGSKKQTALTPIQGMQEGGAKWGKRKPERRAPYEESRPPSLEKSRYTPKNILVCG